MECILFKDMDSTSNTEFPSIERMAYVFKFQQKKIFKLEKRTNSRKIARQRLGNMKRKTQTNKKTHNHQSKERLEQRTKKTVKKREVSITATKKE